MPSSEHTNSDINTHSRTEPGTDSGDNSRMKASLRQQLRARRKSLTAPQQKHAASNVAQHLATLGCYQNAKNVAAYLASDGEISADRILESAYQDGKQCFVPRIQGRQMDFAVYKPSDPLVANQYGILEPSVTATAIQPNKLDIVLMPLVAFDRDGKRLGMGGGYYDRCFEFRKTADCSRPILIGLAHDCQQIADIPNDTWDMPLDIIITDVSVLSITT